MFIWKMIKTLGELIVYCICFQIAFFIALWTIANIFNMVVRLFLGGGENE